MMPGPHLEPAAGGAPIPLDRDSMTVGRLPDNDLQLDDPMVSRHHARLQRGGANLVVYDLGSANGTFVNDTRVTGQAPVREGDTIRFGGTTFTLRGLPAAETSLFPASPQTGAPPMAPGGPPPYAPSGGPAPYIPSTPPPSGAPAPYIPSTSPPSGAPAPYIPSTPPPPGAPAPYVPSTPPPPGAPGYMPGAPPGGGPGGPPLGTPAGPGPAGFPPGGPAPYVPSSPPPPGYPGVVQPGIGQAALEPPGEPPIPLTQPQVVFGRDPTCDFVFADPQVAPRHAMIGRQGNDFFLVDAGSQTGTYLNGQRLTAPRALQPGDQIHIGRTMFTFRQLPTGGQPGTPPGMR